MLTGDPYGPQRPVHGGYPGDHPDGPVPPSVTALLDMMSAREWHACEAAARSTDPAARSSTAIRLGTEGLTSASPSC